MSGTLPDAATLSARLARFGGLKPQPASDWTGDFPLHASLARFYADIGPYGDDADEGLSIPALGELVIIPPLGRLWQLQTGYRSDATSGRSLSGWRNEWLVVAAQGGDPFILNCESGSVLHDRHGRGTWSPLFLFDDIFVMAEALSTIGILYDDVGDALYDSDCEVRPKWRTELCGRLARLLGPERAEFVAARLGW